MSINIDSTDDKQINVGNPTTDEGPESVLNINYNDDAMLGVDLLANISKKSEEVSNDNSGGSAGYASGGEESVKSDKSNKEDFNFLLYSSFDQNGYETSIDVSSQLNQKLITGLIFGYEVFNETINYQKGIDLKTYSITNNYNRVFLSIYLGLLYN